MEFPVLKIQLFLDGLLGDFFALSDFILSTNN
jgi:hypothetical protein